ncbi:Sugar transport protein MST3 like [Verticillium longisporum]|nr:Sugar transport protein MST3 like [Verticillium longisporum]
MASSLSVDELAQVAQESGNVGRKPITSFSQRLDPEQTTAIQLVTSNTEPGFQHIWRYKRVFGWCLTIFILPINFGYEASLLGNCLAIPLKISTHFQQLWNGAAMIGIFVAAYSAGFASDILGRRLVIYIGCVLCIVGVVVQSFAESAITIFGGKLVSTLGFGLGHVLAPVFVAEIAPDELRGICLTLINTMIVLGQWGCALVAYGGSFIASDWGWRMPFLTQLVPPVLMLALAVPLLPESPSWLLLKGRREESGKSLEKFHGADLDVEAKLAVLEAAIEQEHSVSQDKASYLDCFKGSNKRRTTIIVMAYLA